MIPCGTNCGHVHVKKTPVCVGGVATCCRCLVFVLTVIVYHILPTIGNSWVFPLVSLLEYREIRILSSAHRLPAVCCTDFPRVHRLALKHIENCSIPWCITDSEIIAVQVQVQEDSDVKYCTPSAALILKWSNIMESHLSSFSAICND